MKLDDVVSHYLLDLRNGNYSSYTLVDYCQKLGRWISLLNGLCGVTELEQVTVLHLRQCVDHLLNAPIDPLLGSGPGRGRKPHGKTLLASSVRGYVRVCKAFFNWCYQEELIENNPVNRLKSPKTVKRVKSTFTPEHIDAILGMCDRSTDLGFRNYVILLVLLDTGIRLGEVCGLLVENVHDTYIKVLGKGRKEREIGIHPEVSKLLWKYIHKHRHPKKSEEPILFLTRSGTPLTDGAVKMIIELIREKSGLTDLDFSVHTFRHTFAKWYMKRGGDVLKLSREMGHSSVMVTKIYLEDFGSEDARQDHTSFSPVGLLDLKKQVKKKRVKKRE